MGGLACTEGLRRRFGGVLAVDGVTMTVPERAVYGFVGPNGSGKTTTLKMLLGLLAPCEGRITIAGLDVGRERLAIARQVGALLEAQGFYPNLTGAQNLDLSRRLLGLPATEIDRLLELVELRHAADRRVAGYSLGMRQRLGIARAMLGAPRLLVLDEPTNGLDPDGIAQMRGFLRDLPARSNVTVLVSSHLLGEVEHSATHVGIMHGGRLVREGALQALKKGAARRVLVESAAAARAAACLSSVFDVTAGRDNVAIHLKPGEDLAAVVASISTRLLGAALLFTAIRECGASLEDLYNVAVADAVREAA